MEYRGYTATVTLDEALGLYHGSVVGAGFVVSFEVGSVEKLPTAFAEAVDEYVAFCGQDGVAPEAPGSP